MKWWILVVVLLLVGCSSETVKDSSTVEVEEEVVENLTITETCEESPFCLDNHTRAKNSTSCEIVEQEDCGESGEPSCMNGICVTHNECKSVNGLLKCVETAGLGKSSCSPLNSDCSICGDGIITMDEECDGTNLGNNNTCVLRGFDKGDISCTSNCELNITACEVCGNNIIEGSEQCDGDNLNGLTRCEEVNFRLIGDLKCISSDESLGCLYDTESCNG
jgi:hypothetical protein